MDSCASALEDARLAMSAKKVTPNSAISDPVLLEHYTQVDIGDTRLQVPFLLPPSVLLLTREGGYRCSSGTAT